MKKRCVDPECNKKFVISKYEWKFRKQLVPYPEDVGLCPPCLKDVCQIAYDHSYFGSIQEWGAPSL